MSIPQTDDMPVAEFDALTSSPYLGHQPGDALVLPVDELPESASSPELVSRRVRDELMLDGNARLNLAASTPTARNACSPPSAGCARPAPRW